MITSPSTFNVGDFNLETRLRLSRSELLDGASVSLRGSPSRFQSCDGLNHAT